MRTYLVALPIAYLVIIVFASLLVSKHGWVSQMVSRDWSAASPGSVMTLEQVWRCCGFRGVHDRPVPATCVKDPGFGFGRSCEAPLVGSLERVVAGAGVWGLVQGVLGFVVTVSVWALVRGDSVEEREWMLPEQSQTHRWRAAEASGLEEARRLNREVRSL